MAKAAAIQSRANLSTAYLGALPWIKFNPPDPFNFRRLVQDVHLYKVLLLIIQWCFLVARWGSRTSCLRLRKEEDSCRKRVSAHASSYGYGSARAVAAFGAVASLGAAPRGLVQGEARDVAQRSLP